MKYFYNIPTPLEAHNIMNLRLLLEKNVKVCFLNSYPRSGNTWCRLILGNCQNNFSDLVDTLDGDKLDNLIPDIHSFDLSGLNYGEHDGYLIIKTHWPNYFIHAFFGEKYSNTTKHIYIIRHPSDAIYSYFQYQKGRNLINPSTDFHAFALREIRIWRDFYETLHDDKHQPNTIIFSYESLLKHTKEITNQLLKSLEIIKPRSTIDSILSALTFENLQNKESKQSHKSQEDLFFRKGKIGGNINEINPETMSVFEYVFREVNGLLKVY